MLNQNFTWHACRDQLKRAVLGYIYNDKIGVKPDTVTFTYEDHDMWEFSMDVTLGDRVFNLWMCQGANIIELTEKWHRGTFADAAALAGMDRIGRFFK